MVDNAALEIIAVANALLSDLDSTIAGWRRMDRTVRGYFERAPEHQLFWRLTSLTGRIRSQPWQFDRAVRKATVRDVPHWRGVDSKTVERLAADDLVALLVPLASHPDGHVREAATRALARDAGRRIEVLAVRALDHVPEVRAVAIPAVADGLANPAGDRFQLATLEFLLSRRGRRLAPELAETTQTLVASRERVRRLIDQQHPRSIAAVLAADQQSVRTKDLLHARSLQLIGEGLRRSSSWQLRRLLEWHENVGRTEPFATWVHASTAFPAATQQALSTSEQRRLECHRHAPLRDLAIRGAFSPSTESA